MKHWIPIMVKIHRLGIGWIGGTTPPYGKWQCIYACLLGSRPKFDIYIRVCWTTLHFVLQLLRFWVCSWNAISTWPGLRASARSTIVALVVVEICSSEYMLWPIYACWLYYLFMTLWSQFSPWYITWRETVSKANQLSLMISVPALLVHYA